MPGAIHTRPIPALAILLLFSLCVAPVHAQVRFDVPAQPLAKALTALGSQAGLNIYFEPAAVRGLQAPALKAELSSDAALARLLSGTGLRAVRVNENTLRIVRDDPPEPADIPRSTTSSGPYRPTPLLLADARAGAGVSSTDGASERRAPERDSKQHADGTPQTQSLEEVVVTGTHIRGAAADSSPLTVYDRQAIDRSGAATVEQFMRTVPQNFGLIGADTVYDAGQNPQAPQNLAYGSGVNLRGLGAGSTLVLLDGHRLAPAGADGSFVDVSLIPLSALERVDILTDGASAIYGADAVAGVVNFVLRRDFRGAETAVRYQDSTRGGGAERDVSQLLGDTWASGHAMLAYDFDKQSGLSSSSRDFVPDQGGALLLLPKQTLHSALATVRQRLADRTEAFAEAYLANRDFVDESHQNLGGVSFLSNYTGAAAQYGGALGLDQGLGGDWRGEITATYGLYHDHMVQQGMFAGSPYTYFFGVASELLSGDVKLDGSILTLPGGSMKASVGGGVREEKFDDHRGDSINAGNLRRRVGDAFVELLVPLIGGASAIRGAQRLELTLAGRYDDYQVIGSSLDPKVGLLWSPAGGLNFRSTYSRAFRPPTLAQLSSVNEVAIVGPLTDPASGAQVVTLLRQATSNPALEPEKSRSFTVGFDWKPPAIPGLSLSSTYFHIDYDNRISQPPLLNGDFNGLYSQTSALAPFIQRPADPATVQSIYNSAALLINTDPKGNPIPASAVQAIFDYRVQNIAHSRASGIEASLTDAVDTGIGALNFSLAGDYLRKLESQSTSATPSVNLVDTIFNPTHLRLRGGAAYSRGGFSSSLFINYVSAYQNNAVTPSVGVSSFTTADLQLGYRFDQAGVSALKGLSGTLSVLNLLDRDPPHVPDNNNPSFNLGYDPTNATPLGRVIALQLSERW
jgi:outer membrane receptor protein involved in Fe transport